MAKRIMSNNTLAVLIIFTIFVSLLGTWDSLNRIQSITGAASTAAGTVNLTITRTASITCNSCNLSFADTLVGNSRDSVESGDVQNCGSDFQCGINISNDGSIPVNVSFSSFALIHTIAPKGISSLLNKILQYLCAKAVFPTPPAPETVMTLSRSLFTIVISFFKSSLLPTNPPSAS